MAANKWSIRNYNAWIKAARAETGMSLPHARRAYASMRRAMDRPLYGVDVKRYGTSPRATVPVRSLDQWEDIYDDYDYYDPGEFAAGVDYGRRR